MHSNISTEYAGNAPHGYDDKRVVIGSRARHKSDLACCINPSAKVPGMQGLH
jgi:hypothetical protein